LKGRTKMWDVFLDDIGLDNNLELTLASLDLNGPMLESITFDDDDPLKGSLSTSTNVDLGLDMEEDGGEGSGSSDDLDDYRCGMEEDLDE